MADNPPPPDICAIDGCDRPVKSRGWCSTHYMRWRRNGDPQVVRPRGRPARPLDMTEEDIADFLWTKDPVGYMQFIEFRDKLDALAALNDPDRRLARRLMRDGR